MKKFAVLKNKLDLKTEKFLLKEEKEMFLFYNGNGKVDVKFIRTPNGEVFSAIKVKDSVIKEKRDPLILETYLSSFYNTAGTIRKVYKSEKYAGLTLASYERKDGTMNPFYVCFSEEMLEADWIDVEITGLSVFSEDEIVSMSDDCLSNSLRSPEGIAELCGLIDLKNYSEQSKAIWHIVRNSEDLRESMFGDSYHLHELPEKDFDIMIKKYGTMPLYLYRFFEKAVNDEYPYEVSEGASLSDFLNNVLKNIREATKTMKKSL